MACSDPAPTEPAARDWTPPELSVSAPLRGAIVDAAGSVEVRGRATDSGGGVARVTVNGAAVALAADGSFSATVPIAPGITLITTHAVDRDGNDRSETRAVLSGELVPVETVVPAGMLVRLDRQLLVAAAALGVRALDELDLGAIAAAKNPLVNLSSSCFGGRVEVREAKKGPARISLVPVDGGLDLDSAISDLSVTLHVAYDVACKKGEGDVIISARSFRVAGTLGLGLGPDGQAALDASQTTAAFDDFQWGGDLLPAGVSDFIAKPLGDALAAFIADQMHQQLSALVADRLRGQDQTVGVGAEHLVVSLSPAILRVDAGGIFAQMDTRAYIAAAPGTIFPRAPAGPGPDLDRAPRSLGVSIAGDTLNEVLASLWGAGVLDRGLDIDSPKLQELGTVFNHLEVTSRLPPVAEVLPGGLRITIADLELRFEQRQPGATTKIAGRVITSLRATFAARVAGGHLAVTTDAPELHLDVAPEPGDEPSTINEDSLRALGGFVTDTVVGLLNDALADVPLPGIGGLDLVGGEVTTDSGRIIVRADVALP